MDREHTCCVTGHRDIPMAKARFVQDRLHQEIRQAIKVATQLRWMQRFPTQGEWIPQIWISSGL